MQAQIIASGSAIAITSPDGRVDRFHAILLRDNAYDVERDNGAGWLADPVVTWDGNLGDKVPTVAFQRAAGDRRALGDWLGAVRRSRFDHFAPLLQRVVDRHVGARNPA